MGDRWSAGDGWTTNFLRYSPVTGMHAWRKTHVLKHTHSQLITNLSDTIPVTLTINKKKKNKSTRISHHSPHRPLIPPTTAQPTVFNIKSLTWWKMNWNTLCLLFFVQKLWRISHWWFILNAHPKRLQRVKATVYGNQNESDVRYNIN